MKRILLLCTALALSGSSLILVSTARGAEAPVGIHLSGRASSDNQTWQFEIIMEGYDLYYRKEWSGNQDAAKAAGEGFYVVALAMNDAAGETGRSWSRLGERGGGNFGDDGRGRAELARRLWQGSKFRGVAADELRELLGSGHETEEFTTPISRDNFPIPTVIQWTDNTSSMPNKTISYTIEKVEFIHQPNPQFFADARKKYFSDIEQHSSSEKPPRDEPPSESQQIAADALKEARQDRDDAVVTLRAALWRFPLDQPLGAWNQSVLLGALWQIRGMEEKRELVDWFYRALPLAPKDPSRSRHGDMDHGPRCLIDEIEEGRRPEKAELLKALVADPRFDQTDAATVDELMEWSCEGFPIPKEIALDERGSALPKGNVQLKLLPLWRNILRRHYGLHEEPLLHGENQ